MCLLATLVHFYYSLMRSGVLSTPLTSSEPHGLPILLQLRNQRVALSDNILVLPIFIVRPIRLNDGVDAVDGAGDAIGGDELGEVTRSMSV